MCDLKPEARTVEPPYDACAITPLIITHASCAGKTARVSGIESASVNVRSTGVMR